MSVISWLDHIGTAIANDFKKAEPVIEKTVVEAGEAASPFIALYAPGLMPLVSSTLTAIANAQAAGVAAAQNTPGTDAAKFSAVLSTIAPLATAYLSQNSIVANTAEITAFINALVDAINALPAPSTPAPVTPVTINGATTISPQTASVVRIDGAKPLGL